MRRVLLFGLLAVALGLNGAGAQVYPDKTIKIVVPFTPGSPVDVLGRVIAQQLSGRLGQSVIIDNRPGAGTSIGAKAVATAEPDGHTLLLTGTNLVYLPELYRNLEFDPIKSFAAVATLTTWSHALVVASSVPANTVAEFIAYAKANPGKLNFGFGLGTTPQILGEYFKAITGVDINSVPYRGGAQAISDMLGDRIHMNFGTTATLLALIRQGNVRVLAYTGVTRHPDLPAVPTVIEAGLPQLAFNPDVCIGLLAPAGTPAAVVDKLNLAANESLKSPETLASFAKLGIAPASSSPQEFAAFLVAEARKWPPILKASGVKPE
jgi:tripartite-type tricarboxylate transporter receptor subunit TctC